MPRSSKPASLDGALVMDKPRGKTSHDVVEAVRRIVGFRQIGHLGTPDPLATGVLVLLGCPSTGNHDLWMQAGRGRLVPRDGAALRRNANYHRGSGI